MPALLHSLPISPIALKLSNRVMRLWQIKITHLSINSVHRLQLSKLCWKYNLILLLRDIFNSVHYPLNLLCLLVCPSISMSLCYSVLHLRPSLPLPVNVKWKSKESFHFRSMSSIEWFSWLVPGRAAAILSMNFSLAKSTKRLFSVWRECPAAAAGPRVVR